MKKPDSPTLVSREGERHKSPRQSSLLFRCDMPPTLTRTLRPCTQDEHPDRTAISTDQARPQPRTHLARRRFEAEPPRLFFCITIPSSELELPDGGARLGVDIVSARAVMGLIVHWYEMGGDSCSVAGKSNVS